MAPASPASTAATAFHYFGELPEELRVMIWRYALLDLTPRILHPTFAVASIWTRDRIGESCAEAKRMLKKLRNEYAHDYQSVNYGRRPRYRTVSKRELRPHLRLFDLGPTVWYFRENFHLLELDPNQPPLGPGFVRLIDGSSPLATIFKDHPKTVKHIALHVHDDQSLKHASVILFGFAWKHAHLKTLVIVFRYGEKPNYKPYDGTYAVKVLQGLHSVDNDCSAVVLRDQDFPQWIVEMRGMRAGILATVRSKITFLALGMESCDEYKEVNKKVCGISPGGLLKD